MLLSIIASRHRCSMPARRSSSAEFSFFSCAIWVSRQCTWSTFRRRERRADSRFEIIRLKRRSSSFVICLSGSFSLSFSASMERSSSSSSDPHDDGGGVDFAVPLGRVVVGSLAGFFTVTFCSQFTQASAATRSMLGSTLLVSRLGPGADESGSVLAASTGNGDGCPSGEFSEKYARSKSIDATLGRSRNSSAPSCWSSP
mmetsp:Transcript_21559/g.36063  ORF Transcript_21559/g.36063 Transcript_21559/m.36063 type:complete len:200 (+) Transcript_21559:739-1338(+)